VSGLGCLAWQRTALGLLAAATTRAASNAYRERIDASKSAQLTTPQVILASMTHLWALTTMYASHYGRDTATERRQ
jgi:uncharacterized membrane protein YidH (DUF202 family)